MNDKLKSIFSKVLPTIAAAVVPGGPLAQMGINAVIKALGVDKIDPTPEAMDAAITEAQSKNPEIFLELKKVEADLQKQLAEMGYDSEEKILALQNADRDSARQREIALKDRLPAILAIGVTVFLFAMIGTILAKGVPDSGHDIVLALVETVKIAFVTIVSYYFGSSSGSVKKTEMLAGNGK